MEITDNGIRSREINIYTQIYIYRERERSGEKEERLLYPYYNLPVAAIARYRSSRSFVFFLNLIYFFISP